MYEWEIVGLQKRLEEIGELPRSVRTAASRSINRTADRARTQTAREVRQQVAFPASYLAPRGGRLSVTKKASSDSLEARIKARFRPTSLARFVTRWWGKTGATVEVKPGRTVELPRVFQISLRGGVDGPNKGLAVRLKKGTELRNRKLAKRVASGLYVLYGPSVAQVARTVFEDISDESVDFMRAEFERQMRLQNR